MVALPPVDPEDARRWLRAKRPKERIMQPLRLKVWVRLAKAAEALELLSSDAGGQAAAKVLRKRLNAAGSLAGPVKLPGAVAGVSGWRRWEPWARAVVTNAAARGNLKHLKAKIANAAAGALASLPGAVLSGPASTAIKVAVKLLKAAKKGVVYVVRKVADIRKGRVPRPGGPKGTVPRPGGPKGTVPRPGKPRVPRPNRKPHAPRKAPDKRVPGGLAAGAAGAGAAAAGAAGAAAGAQLGRPSSWPVWMQIMGALGVGYVASRVAKAAK